MDEWTNKVMALYNVGYSVTEIAQKLYVSEETVRTFIDAHEKEEKKENIKKALKKCLKTVGAAIGCIFIFDLGRVIGLLQGEAITNKMFSDICNESPELKEPLEKTLKELSTK